MTTSTAESAIPAAIPHSAQVQAEQARKNDNVNLTSSATAATLRHQVENDATQPKETSVPRDTELAEKEEKGSNGKSRNPDVIHRNSSVLLKMPSGNYKLLELKKEKKTKHTKGNHRISLGKFGDFELDALIGKYYGIPLEIVERGAHRLLHSHVSG